MKKISLGLLLFLAFVSSIFGNGFIVTANDTVPPVFIESSQQVSPTLDETIFVNVAAKAGEESAKITWSIDHKAYNFLRDNDYQVIIKYIGAIAKKRLKNNVEGVDWQYTQPLDISTTEFNISEITGNDKYTFALGLYKNGAYTNVWSIDAECKTERGWGITKLLILIGALAFFIFGMKLMSEGLQQAAGNRLRGMLGSMTSNRVKGVFTGFGITSIVQSSSVTTVMTVSFVNAGLMTLKQSAGVMMGANVGTTITGWLVLLLGFKVSVSSYAYIIIALAAPLLFMQRGKAKAWASAIFGFCILFIGLDVLKETVPHLDASSGIVQFFIDYKNAWYGPVMFVMLGTIVTIVVQSSSAAMALTLAMVSTGAIPFEVACAMILGENIGTTITAAIAALVANVHAKRAARIHFMFNIVGVVWMLLVFPWFLKGLSYFVSGDPFTDLAVAGTTIALFHTSFNIINVLLLIWFVPQLVRFAERTVKSKGESDEEFKLDYIGGPIGSTAELCILEAKKEVSKFGEVTARMNGFVHKALNSADKKLNSKMYTKLEKYEEITDRVEIEITEYLGKVAQLEMSEDASMRMRGMLSITNDLERVGDIFFQMSKALEKKEDEKIYFTPEQRNGLNKMSGAVDKAFKIMNSNLEAEYGNISLDDAKNAERTINALRNDMRKEHLTMIESREFNIQGALLYSNLFSSLEKVGDHIINVSEAVAGEI